jgi:hypothetical protein
MIKIVSGTSVPVGSTVSLVNMCNQLNAKGHECVFYGPDKWHLDKCNSGGIEEFHPESCDIVIIHNIRLMSGLELYNLRAKTAEKRSFEWVQVLKDRIVSLLPATGKPPGVRLILTRMGNESFSLRQTKYSLFDKVHYPCGTIKQNQNITHPFFICPGFHKELTNSRQKPVNVGGVIGTIRKENKTDSAIENALNDGMQSVIVYGYLADPLYYYTSIEPLAKKYRGRIQFAGFVDSQQKIYDSVSDVYCAIKKPWSPVQHECSLTGTLYHGPGASEENIMMTNDSILDIWKLHLEL